ncbi:hypothetical protein BGX38DRAFT_1230277 [Terfezia claveryi]|nr:hypothetical protein BGX38DRAFT_1230277 [Terfezia claveryi]
MDVRSVILRTSFLSELPQIVHEIQLRVEDTGELRLRVLTAFVPACPWLGGGAEGFVSSQE